MTKTVAETSSDEDEFTAEFLDNLAKDEHGNYIDPEAPIHEDRAALMFMGSAIDFRASMIEMYDKAMEKEKMKGKNKGSAKARKEMQPSAIVKCAYPPDGTTQAGEVINPNGSIEGTLAQDDRKHVHGNSPSRSIDGTVKPIDVEVGTSLPNINYTLPSQTPASHVVANGPNDGGTKQTAAADLSVDTSTTGVNHLRLLSPKEPERVKAQTNIAGATLSATDDATTQTVATGSEKVLTKIRNLASAIEVPSSKAEIPRKQIPEDIKMSIKMVVSDIVSVARRHADATGDSFAFFDVWDVVMEEVKRYNTKGYKKKK